MLTAESFAALGLGRVERPPLLWEPASDDESLRLLIAALVRETGVEPDRLVLGLSNVEIARDAAGEHLAESEYVGVTVRGEGSWAEDAVWSRAMPPAAGIVGRVQEAMLGANAASAYSRSLSDGSSLTVLIPRASSSGPQ